MLTMPTPLPVTVRTSTYRGLPVEEWADMLLARVISVSDTAPEPLRQQANEYREHLRAIFIHYMREAIRSDRTTIHAALASAGHPQLAAMIKDL